MRNERGLTLLEVVISLVILSVGILAIAHLFPMGLRSSERAAEFSKVGTVVSDALNKLRYAVFIYDPGDIDEYGNVNPNYNGVGYYELWKKYHGAYSLYLSSGEVSAELKLEDDPQKPADVLQKVFLKVTWTVGERERSDVIVSYISNPFYEDYGDVLP